MEPPATGGLDGVSQLETLEGGAGPRETIVTYLPHYFPLPGTIPASSLRRGDEKLIRYHFAAPGQRDRFELYDLGRDPGERNDLAARRPERVEALAAELARQLEAMAALLPERNPRYRERPAQTAVQDAS